jgi:hypothetical protein
MSGFLAALIAGENKRSPLVLGVLLLAFDLLIVVLSWRMFPFGMGYLYGASNSNDDYWRQTENHHLGKRKQQRSNVYGENYGNWRVFFKSRNKGANWRHGIRRISAST